MESNSIAQGITINRPPHDELPVAARPASVVADWPAGTFVENIAVGSAGELYISVESLGEVQRLRDGVRDTFIRPTGSVTGLAVIGNDVCVSTGTIGAPGWVVRCFHTDAVARADVKLPDALFLNGSTLFKDQQILVADSIHGRIYWVDLATRTSRIWLEHDLFRKISAEPMLPGINGIRVSGRTLYFTNTDRSIVGKVAIASDGSPGTVSVLAERLVGDDFAVAEDNSLFITNHVYNTLTHLYPSGKREVIAGPAEHMQGCTSAVFGRTAETSRSLFVTTTGGILSPYEGIVREAKVVRVDVGVLSAVVGMGDEA